MSRFSWTARAHFSNPMNVGTLESFDVKGIAGRIGGGPYLVIYIKEQAGAVGEVSYQTYGCPAAIAAGSMITELIKGRRLQDASRIDSAQLLTNLGGLPRGKEHCADLAVNALKDALSKLKTKAAE